MSGRQLASVTLLAMVGVALAAGVLHSRETSYPLPPVTERLMYLRSGKTADRLMLSFDALAADVYWIRAIQHYGRDLKDRNRSGRFELVMPLLDLTTTLDPNFLIAYRFGAVFLALQPPNGPGRADLAIRLLEKGVAANPTRWQLAHDLAFVHYFHTGDFLAASDWFERAAAMPRAPKWLAPLAAHTKAQGGNRQGARQMLLELRDSEESYIRKAAERTLAQLDALDAIDTLQSVIDRFTAAEGRYPASWEELVSRRALQAVPADSERVPFAYDRETGRVKLSPESPLSPLPETLSRR
jgi:tetratricopeptide (TPR) repeat protein